MSTPDLGELRAKAEHFLVQCGACDAGLPMGCVCSPDDPRPVIADLLAEIATLTAQRDRAERRHERLEAGVEALAGELQRQSESECYSDADVTRTNAQARASSDLRALLAESAASEEGA